MMFDFEQLADEINDFWPHLTTKQLTELFVSEALMNMRKYLCMNNAKEHYWHNKTTDFYLKNLMVTPALVPAFLFEAVEQAVKTGKQCALEQNLDFMSRLTGAMIRAAYRIDCVVEEAKEGYVNVMPKYVDGMHYTGPHIAYVSRSTVREAIDEVSKLFSECYEATINECGRWFKQNHPSLEFGGRYDDDVGRWIPHLSVDDALRSFTSNTSALGWERPHADARKTAIDNAISIISQTNKTKGDDC